MSIFEGYRKNVSFDGKDLSMWYDLYVVDLDANKDNQFGVRKTITYSGDSFVKAKGERFAIDVTFARINNGNVLQIDDKLMDDLSLLFFRKNEPVIMNVGGKLYYVVPTDGTIRKLKNGYFTISLESVSPYCYSNIRADEKRVIDKIKDIEIRNLGITDVYLDLEFEGKASTVIIKNTTNGNSIEVNNLVGEDVQIFGDTMEVLGIDYNRIKGNIKDTLLLRYGTNRFSIEVVGDIRVQFRHQIQFGLM